MERTNNIEEHNFRKIKRNQRRIHVYMQREDATVTVPLNDPVKKTTLKSILNQEIYKK